MTGTQRPGEAPDVVKARLDLLANLRDHRGWALPSSLAMVDAFAAAVRAEEREKIAPLRGALRSLRSIGARSGTNINAWNEAFDVIDAALAREAGS